MIDSPLRDLYQIALDAIDARAGTARTLASEALDSPVVLLAVGKAGCAMAQGALDALGDRLVRGVVHTRAGQARRVGSLAVREAGHPLPDARSLACAQEALEIARAVRPGQRLLVLISGGASALWCAPSAGLSLGDKLDVTDALLRVGAPIEDLNRVRAQLSRIKGGGLARASGTSHIYTLAQSDVRDDVPATIGSGPTIPHASSPSAALAALQRHLEPARIPERVRRHLERGLRSSSAGPAAPASGEFALVGSLGQALCAVRRAAEARGWAVRDLGASVYGEVEFEARRLAEAARAARAAGERLVVAGGEPVVRVRGPGRGGRCQELALRLAVELAGERGISVLCAGTDGSDGPTDAAGAIVDGRTQERALRLGQDPQEVLARSDAYTLLDRTGSLLRTGPTHANVADLVLMSTDPTPVHDG